METTPGRKLVDARTTTTLILFHLQYYIINAQNALMSIRNPDDCNHTIRDNKKGY